MGFLEYDLFCSKGKSVSVNLGSIKKQGESLSILVDGTKISNLIYRRKNRRDLIII